MNDSPMTWQDIYEALAALTPEQRAQPAEIWPYSSNGDEPICLQPIVAIDSVGALACEDDVVHGVANWQRNDDQIVILVDAHPYGPNGEFAYDSWDDDAKPIAWAPGATPVDSNLSDLIGGE